MSDKVVSPVWSYRKFLFGFVKALSLPTVLVIAACATGAPVQEMSDARQAVAAANEVGADQYYPELLEEANMRLESAEKNMRSGVYWAAKRDADAAKDFAIDALLSTRNRLDEQHGKQGDQQSAEQNAEQNDGSVKPDTVP